VRWLPLVVATAYVVTVAVKAAGLIDAVYWDTDAAAPFVLAERLRGHGPVLIQHFGSWTVLWALLATRHLPGHATLWEAAGYPFSVAGAAFLGLATGRVAGRWAGVTAAAVALLVGPLVLRSQLTVIYHVVPPFTVAVVAAYLVTLGRLRRPFGTVLSLLVGLLLGANAASDPLLWLAGVVPFSLAAGLLWVGTRRKEVAVDAAVVLLATIGSAAATHLVMHGLGYHVLGLAPHRTAIRSLPAAVEHLGRMVALLGGANYALPGGYPREPVRIVLALAAIAGVLTPFAAAWRVRRTVRARAYAWYWAASVLCLALGFVATTNARALGAGSMNYLLPLTLAAGAGIGLLCAGSVRREVAAGLVVAAVGVVNIAGLVQGHAGTGQGVLATHATALVQFLERRHVTRGYAGYWDAQNLSWQSGMRVIVAPVARCGPSLCAYDFAVVRSWFERGPGPSFLIVDPSTPFVQTAPPFARGAAEERAFGPLEVYVFKDDLARHIRFA
jgi:hypothetical protein